MLHKCINRFVSHGIGITVASIMISVANIDSVSGSAQRQLTVWSTCALAHAVSAFEGYLLWGLASCIHQMDLPLLWDLQCARTTIKIMFPLITFTIMDTILRLFSIVCPREVKDGTALLGLYPSLGLF